MNQGGFGPDYPMHWRNTSTNQAIWSTQQMSNFYYPLKTSSPLFQAQSYMAQSHHYYGKYNQFANFTYNQHLHQQYKNMFNMGGTQHFSQIEQNIATQVIPTPPPIDSHDSYVHYQYLESLKNNYKFDNVHNPPPYILTTYLLKYLSLEQCPYPLSALSYIATNIPHFYIHFAPHQLHFLESIINHKYPYQIDYRKEYKKLLIMDKSQAPKLLDLLQTICILVSQFEQQKKYFKNMNGDEKRDRYIIWVMNCLQVMLAHQHIIQSLPYNKRGEDYETLLNHIKQNIHNHTEQFISLIGCISDQSNNQSLWNKINMLVYDLIPSNQIVQQNQLVSVYRLIQTAQKVTYGRKYNHFNHPQHRLNPKNNNYQLFNAFNTILSGQMKKISNKILKIQGKLSVNSTIAQLHQLFCFKVLNIISLKLWSKHQKLQFVKFISGCNFICGINISTKQKFEACSELLSYAFQLAKQKTCHHQRHNKQQHKQQQFPLFDQNNNDDVW